MVVRSVLVSGLLGVAVLGLSGSVVMIGAAPAGGAAVVLATAADTADSSAAADASGPVAGRDATPQPHPSEYDPHGPMPYPAEGAWELLFRGWR
jgi:hypothetical protein